MKEIVSEGKQQDTNSEQSRKRPAKKGVTKSNPNKKVQEGKHSEERDNTHLATSNKSNRSRQTLKTVPEMSSLDSETPPTARSSPKESIEAEFVEEIDKSDLLCPCPFECGIEPCSISLIKDHINVSHIEHHEKDGEASATEEDDNIIRQTFRSSPKGLLTCTNFKKLLRQNTLHEVVIPGNGYCFLSALLITLAEQGVDKQMAVLAHEVMTQIRSNIRFYKDFHSDMSKEEFLTACSDFFQRGAYSHEVVDVCIGATANALGVNLNVVQKNPKTVALTRYDCKLYKSSMNLFVIYYTPSKKGKNLDGHYNCYVKEDYFKQNKAAIFAHTVKPIEEIQLEVTPTTSSDNVSQSSMETSKT